jgi:hypothetical protein
MTIEFTISEKDFVNSAKLSSYASRKQFFWLSFVGLLLLLLAVFGGHKFRYIFLFGVVGGIVGYFFTVFVICPFQARRHYRKYKRIHKPASFTLQKDGYRIWNDGGESVVKWSELLKWRENKDYILLYVAPKLYHILPKRLADSGVDFTDIVDKLESKVGPAT